MADLLSQNDLNALLGLTAEQGASGPTEPAEDTAPAAGLSQGDLDSLLAGLADFTPAARPKCAAPAQQNCAVASGGTLSQEEIDRLLADFGR
jgi:flagellar motor switch protein FliM